MPQFSIEQQREIMRKARENISRRPSETQRSSSSESEVVYKTHVPDDADALAAPIVAKPWWEWVQEHVDHRLEAFGEAVGEVIGTETQETREAMKQENRDLKRELKLLRREFNTLREEVGLERGLRDLRSEIVKAHRQVPKIPAIESRLRAEATISRVDMDTKIVALQRELETAKRTVSALKARQSNFNFNLERWLTGSQTSEVEYESSSKRILFRQRVHPDAAQALREFAAQVIEHDDSVH